MSEVEYHKRLKIRKRTASLAYDLFSFYKEKKTTLPDEVLKWKTICEDPEEFGEIQAQWEPC